MSDLFNVSTNPHVRSKDTTQTIMRDVLIALTPASIFGIYNFGLGALQSVWQQKEHTSILCTKK